AFPALWAVKRDRQQVLIEQIFNVIGCLAVVDPLLERGNIVSGRTYVQQPEAARGIRRGRVHFQFRPAIRDVLMNQSVSRLPCRVKLVPDLVVQRYWKDVGVYTGDNLQRRDAAG